MILSRKSMHANRNDRIELHIHPNVIDPDKVSSLADLYTNLDSVLRKDMLCHYSGSIPALYWITLCRDEKYGHLELVDFIDHSFPQLIRNLRENSPNLSSLSLVSLGPGDGEIDIRILRHLQPAFQVRCYYCLDFSFELLRYTFSRIATEKTLKNDFKIMAILGNFADSDEYLNNQDTVRLFTLNGFTLGNYNESKLLGRIGRLMSERDFLLVDAHLHGLKDWSHEDQIDGLEKIPLLNNYCQEETNRFVFGPIEAATTASAADVTFGRKINRDMTSVPNAMNVTIFCKNLRTRMRFTGEWIERDHLDLASTTFYCYEDLKDWFQLAGFDCVLDRQERNIALFLLKRSPGSST